MVADETGRAPAASTTRARLRWLAVVVAIMAVLTAGWPLLNATVANRQLLSSGAKLTIGPGRASSGTVTVGSGWYMQPAQSNPAFEYVLRKGDITLDIRHVALVSSGQLAFLWRGMRQILAVTNPGSTLSEPVMTTTAHGLPAMTGALSGPRLVGTVTIVADPSRDFAVGMVVLGPRHTSPLARAAARQVVLSLMFAVASR